MMLQTSPVTSVNVNDGGVNIISAVINVIGGVANPDDDVRDVNAGQIRRHI